MGWLKCCALGCIPSCRLASRAQPSHFYAPLPLLPPPSLLAASKLRICARSLCWPPPPPPHAGGVRTREDRLELHQVCRQPGRARPAGRQDGRARSAGRDVPLPNSHAQGPRQQALHLAAVQGPHALQQAQDERHRLLHRPLRRPSHVRDRQLPGEEQGLCGGRAPEPAGGVHAHVCRGALPRPRRGARHAAEGLPLQQPRQPVQAAAGRPDDAAARHGAALRTLHQAQLGQQALTL
eukprot:366087-Chlamydomonas_euryale.AAC.6